jgi:hypothetical protein
VNKIGAADRAQKLWRERKQEMQFTLNDKSGAFLNSLVQHALPMGANLLGREIKPYLTKDMTGVRQILSLQRWAEKELQGIKPEWTKTVGLRKDYITRIIEMLDYYKDLGNLPVIMEYYWQLRDALENRNFKDQLDDPSEAPAPAEAADLPGDKVQVAEEK